MPKVRFLKVFQGYVNYKNVVDIEDIPSVETIETNSFPHTEHNLHIIALIGLPPNFQGEISGRIAWTKVDLGAVEILTQNKKTWLTFDKKLLDVTFPQPGEYPVEILSNNSVIHSFTLQVRKN